MLRSLLLTFVVVLFGSGSANISAQPAYGVHPDQKVSARFSEITYTSKPIVGRDKEERITRKEWYDINGLLLRQVDFDYYTKDTTVRYEFYQSAPNIRMIQKYLSNDSLVSVESGYHNQCNNVYKAYSIDLEDVDHWKEITKSYDNLGRIESSEELGNTKKKIIKYEYDKKNITQIAWIETEFRTSDPIRIKEVHRYNEYGDPVEILVKNITTGKWLKEQFYTNYIYDNKGNWISRMLDAGKKKEFMEKRTIKYQKVSEPVLNTSQKRSIVILPRIFRSEQDNYGETPDSVINTIESWNLVTNKPVRRYIGLPMYRLQYETHEQKIPKSIRLLPPETNPTIHYPAIGQQVTGTYFYDSTGTFSSYKNSNNQKITFETNTHGSSEEIKNFKQKEALDTAMLILPDVVYDECKTAYVSDQNGNSVYYFHNAFGQPLIMWYLNTKKREMELETFSYTKNGWVSSRIHHRFSSSKENSLKHSKTVSRLHAAEKPDMFVKVTKSVDSKNESTTVYDQFLLDSYGNWTRCRVQKITGNEPESTISREIRYHNP